MILGRPKNRQITLSLDNKMRKPMGDLVCKTSNWVVRDYVRPIMYNSSITLIRTVIRPLLRSLYEQLNKNKIL